MKILSVIVLLASIAAPAHAELPKSNPSEVCELLGDIGMQSRGWKAVYDQEYACMSAYKDVNGSDSIPNNIAFYAEGDSSRVKQVKLVLNVNNPRGAVADHAALLKAANHLSVKLSGGALPLLVQGAIRAGTPVSKKEGRQEITVSTEKTGPKVYTVTVLIR